MYWVQASVVHCRALCLRVAVGWLSFELFWKRSKIPISRLHQVGLRWYAGVSCACVPSMVSCSGFGLPMHAQLLRLFVTIIDSTMSSHAGHQNHNIKFPAA